MFSLKYYVPESKRHSGRTSPLTLDAHVHTHTANIILGGKKQEFPLLHCLCCCLQMKTLPQVVLSFTVWRLAPVMADYWPVDQVSCWAV